MTREERNGRLKEGCTMTELALAYFPRSEPKQALRRLVRWIRKSKKLQRQLHAAGYEDCKKQLLTPRIVRLIFHHFDEPGE